MFKGAITAIVTPFKNGEVDYDRFGALIERQIASGIQGLVPAGTTGECPVLSHKEHNAVIAACVEAAAGRVPVIAGTGSNCTDEAVELTRHAEEAGADAALVIVPYYNKPSQEGMYAHFKAVHDATSLPIVLYNVPGRCAADLKDETVVRLAALPRIVGIKDASASLERPAFLRNALGAGFVQLSGEDATALAFNLQGGTGVISVTANVAPRQVAEAQKAFLAGDVAGAVAVDKPLQALHAAMFCCPSPAPAKYALSRLGLCREELRLPLVPPGEAERRRVDAAMEAAGLL
jgi:4-hydroxy-tetrahydrodipicolinate synthase